jgi:tRNA modification GTPase
VLADLDPEDTIAAAASAPGRGMRALVRISGRDAWRIALESFRFERDTPPPRLPGLHRGALAVEGLRPLLPVSIALWRAPRTYTGEDVAELHMAGSPPLLTQVLAVCLKRGARLAQPGEFTLRAFLCGRIDLTRAEAVLGVIEARNSAQLNAALRQLAGGLSRPIHELRDRLLDVVAQLEASLDFAHESDVYPLGRAALAADLESAVETLTVLSGRLVGRDRAAGNPRVVLFGPPNSGKSSLFNTLLGHDRAIVSPRAGTTRDYLTAACDVSGVLIELIDTAGIEVARDPIETQAQGHQADQASQADLLLVCISSDTWAGQSEPMLGDMPALRVWTKCDLGRPDLDQASGAILTSAATGEGLDELRVEIARQLSSSKSGADSPDNTAARCRDSLEGAMVALGSASQTLRDGGGEELVALDLRLALDELGKVVGAIVTEDILDRVFQRFCIGK